MRLKSVIPYVLVFAIGLFAARLIPIDADGGEDVRLASTTTESELCPGHGIDAALCTRCNPALIAEFQAAGDWCAGHAVPESQCTRCNPELIPQFKDRGDWCVEHNLPESQCDLCNPLVGIVEATDDHGGHDHSAEGVAAPSAMTPYPGIAVSYATAEPACPSDGAVIQLASVETAGRAGIVVQHVLTAHAGHPFEAPAEIVFDQTTTTHLSSSLAVSIRQWLVEPGEAVVAAQPVAIVDSPDMAVLQGEYLEAWSDWRVHAREKERSTTMLARGLIDSASHERSIADEVASRGSRVQKRSQLQLAGLSETDIARLEEEGSVSSRFTLRSPIDGTILERPASLGMVLEPGIVLATVGEANSLWIEGRVRDRDLSRVQVGQRMEFIPDAGDARPVPGTVIWVSPFLDAHTRTGTVRVQPVSTTSAIRAREFGRLHVAETDDGMTLLVPRDAVQWEGCCNIVFVRRALDRYDPRKVTIERAGNAHYRVVDGLRPDEEVVVQGSFLLKTEIKKSSIGAGCCGLDAS